MPASFLLQELHVHSWITTDTADQVIHTEKDSP
jgi:hypothetical protein